MYSLGASGLIAAPELRCGSPPEPRHRRRECLNGIRDKRIGSCTLPLRTRRLCRYGHNFIQSIAEARPDVRGYLTRMRREGLGAGTYIPDRDTNRMRVFALRRLPVGIHAIFELQSA